MTTTLEHSPADIVRQLLIDLALGANGGVSWPVYASNEPSSNNSNVPDALIVVTDTASRKDGRSQVSGQLFQHYGVQILVRHPTHKVGFLKASAIERTLSENVNRQSVSLAAAVGETTDTYLVYSLSVNPLLVLGKGPDNNLSFFSINAFVSLRQTA